MDIFKFNKKGTSIVYFKNDKKLKINTVVTFKLLGGMFLNFVFVGVFVYNFNTLNNFNFQIINSYFKCWNC